MIGLISSIVGIVVCWLAVEGGLYVYRSKKASDEKPEMKGGLDWFQVTAEQVKAFLQNLGIVKDIKELNSDVKQVAVYAILVFAEDNILEVIDPAKAEQVSKYLAEIKAAIGPPAA